MTAVRRAPRSIAVLGIRLVRLAMTPLVASSSLTPRVCKYEPTCSHYAEEAVRTHGAVRGLVMAGWRVLRCNPFSKGGYDPVSPR